MIKSSSNASSEPPAPTYILRGHTSQISALAFSADGKTLYSGDIEGWVAVWDLRSFRPRLFWQAHDAGVLAFCEWSGGLLTHGRDNQIQFYHLPLAPPSITRAAASAVPSIKEPTTIFPEWRLDVNAMAYCHFALLETETKKEALIAVPALTKDDQVDIFHLPSFSRVHRSIGEGAFISASIKTGTVMALKTLRHPKDNGALHVLAGYESGQVALFRFTGSAKRAFEPPLKPTAEGEDWELVWIEKGHREALMGLSLSPDERYAWSVGADHFLCRYRLFDDAETDQPDQPRFTQFATSAPGRAEVQVRNDGKLVGVAGWDGEIRIYSTKTGRPLAVLSYHRSSLHAFAFGPVPSLTQTEHLSEGESDEDYSEDEEGAQARSWIAAGGKDEKISLWDLYPPSTTRVVV